MRRDVRAILAFGQWREHWTFAISSSCGARAARNGKALRPEVNRRGHRDNLRRLCAGMQAHRGAPISGRGRRRQGWGVV
jgi:hypothetical protein